MGVSETLVHALEGGEGVCVAAGDGYDLEADFRGFYEALQHFGLVLNFLAVVAELALDPGAPAKYSGGVGGPSECVVVASGQPVHFLAVEGLQLHGELDDVGL